MHLLAKAKVCREVKMEQKDLLQDVRHKCLEQ